MRARRLNGFVVVEIVAFLPEPRPLIEVVGNFHCLLHADHHVLVHHLDVVVVVVDFVDDVAFVCKTKAIEN